MNKDKQIELNKILENFMEKFNISNEEMGKLLEDLRMKEESKHKFD